jgi:hypothetical protein
LLITINKELKIIKENADYLENERKKLEKQNKINERINKARNL